MNIIRKTDLTEASWSGGTTTELYIAPEGASYKMKTFDYRVSTATVTCKASTFTPLASVKRLLMILEGQMKLRHEGLYEKNLKAYEVDTFMGDLKTSSLSEDKVVDFNLMLSPSCEGTLKYLRILEEIEVESDAHMVHRAYYCHQGQVKISVNEQSYTLKAGDYGLIDESERGQKLVINGDAHLVEVKVWSEV